MWVQKLVINQDNGPENHSRRTQFMKRILEFSRKSQLTLQLAYYPPYHSKYNPVERYFGWLEKHWNGSLLDTVESVVNFAKTLAFKDKNPVVTLVETLYPTGVKINKLAMAEIETQINRLPNLHKWFVEIFAITHIAIGSFFLWRSLRCQMGSIQLKIWFLFLFSQNDKRGAFPAIQRPKPLALSGSDRS